MTKFADLKTKKDRIAFIRQQLGSNPAWALRALIRIYENQTAAEQAAHATVEHNGVGFTGADAEILTSLAEQYSKRRSLSEKQMALLFKRIPKYARQLERMAK